MSSDVLSFLRSFFSLVWNSLESIQVPGTNLNGIHLIVAPLGAVAFITVFKKVSDSGAVSASDFNVKPRVSNNDSSSSGNHYYSSDVPRLGAPKD